MLAEPNPLLVALLILVVIMVFNVIIFVHELGHFWAAKWRGLKIDRFQIWFGKPIWSKTINGVQYGLGWIPAGGFVALPQMAPMEAIEGDNREDSEPLPPISPLDKIIVAFAGPLFSFLLALTAAFVITIVGKPLVTAPTTTIGWAVAGMPGAEAGLQRGDRIISINDEPIEMWQGPLDSVFMNIATSRGKEIRFTIDRPEVGEMEVTTKFEIPETKWWQRKKTRVVGLEPMSPEGPVTVGSVNEDKNAPARIAGLMVGDELVSINGNEIVATQQAVDLVKSSEGEPIDIIVKRDGETKNLVVNPVVATAGVGGEPLGYMIGTGFTSPSPYQEEWVKPGPIQQIKDTVRTMWITIRSVTAKDSDIGIQHLSGPVGIGKIQYYSLLMDHPFHRIMAFMVLININLAILNMLPFPVLDGGHITIATMEAIARRPVNFKLLEMLQLGFVFLLFGIMIYVTSKDVVDDFGMGSGDGPTKLVFPAPATE